MCAARITRIEAAGPQRRARRLSFDDAKVVLTAAAVVRALSLGEGDEVDPDTLLLAIVEAETHCARDRALRLLGYRDRSRLELDTKLQQDGYSASVVGSLLDRFTELELLDDDRFAFSLARSLASSGRGRRRIERDLIQKGVDPQTAARASAECSEDSEVTRAAASLRGARASTPKERERLLRRLVARGFDLQTAMEAVGAEDSDHDDPVLN